MPTIFSAGFIPYFITLQKLHLINTFWVYIIPSLFSFMHIVIIRTFLQGIPEELEESARIEAQSLAFWVSRDPARHALLVRKYALEQELDQVRADLDELYEASMRRISERVGTV